MNNIDTLINLTIAARFYGKETPKPAAIASINGKEFSVQYNIVNRECYDALPTPTVCFKIDGKRVSRKAAFAAAKA